MERAEELAQKHWDGYVKPLLISKGIPATEADEFMYVSSFIHGYKHGQEDEKVPDAETLAEMQRKMNEAFRHATT